MKPEVLMHHGDQAIVEVAASLVFPQIPADPNQRRQRVAKKPAANIDKLGARVARQPNGEWHVVTDAALPSDGTITSTIGDHKFHIELGPAAVEKIAAALA